MKRSYSIEMPFRLQNRPDPSLIYFNYESVKATVTKRKSFALGPLQTHHGFEECEALINKML